MSLIPFPRRDAAIDEHPSEPDGDAAPESGKASEDAVGPMRTTPVLLTAADVLPGELALADPRDLFIDSNTRTTVELDPAFVADVAARGVREAITVNRDAEGRLVVRKGQRRTLAAIRAGRELVLIFIERGVAGLDADGTPARIERIVDQLGENFHRAATSDRDADAAVQQLLDLGLSQRAVVERTPFGRDRVRAVAKVNKTELTRRIYQEYDLTLDQMGVVADFTDDDEDVKTLTVCAVTDPGRFELAAERIRQRREDDQLTRARTAELAEDGVRVVEDDLTATPLWKLRPSAESPRGAELTDADHASCPSHAVVLEIDRYSARAEPVVRVRPVCVDPAAHGHAERYPRASTADAAAQRTGPMTEAERAARRAVIANNKAWPVATVVRRRFLTALLARRRAPADAALVVASLLAHGSAHLGRAAEAGHPDACALLGLAEPPRRYTGGPNPLDAEIASAGPARGVPVCLAIAFGAVESGLDKSSWRNPSAELKRYLTVLQRWGHQLSAVEELVLTDPDHIDPEPEDGPGVPDRPDPDEPPDVAGGDGA